MLMATLWWLTFLTAIGLCLGSFLNVVICRLPSDQSLRDPVWSACPACCHRIRWYDNLPIVSYLWLGGRCRDCGGIISARYVIIEASMALIVLVLLDAFAIESGLRHGLSQSPFGLTDHLASDWPILLAHIILFAAMLSMAAIDLEHYWVDVRVTNLAIVAGLVLHALWTPTHSMMARGDAGVWVRPSDTLAIASLMAIVGLGIAWIVGVCQVDPDDEDLSPCHDGDDIEPAGQDADAADNTACAQERHPPARRTAWIAIAAIVALLAVLAAREAGSWAIPHAPRAILPALLFLGLIVRHSLVRREANHAIAEAIEQERHDARGMVLVELVWLMPAIILFGLAYWLVAGDGDNITGVSELLHVQIRVPGVRSMSHWQPIYGLATAVTGYVIAGAIGWSIRIVFTLGFGKEAFGTGDIHLMAAAGCVAGWPVVALGFVLTCGLAVVGWLCTLPVKRTRTIPLGPWLALSFLIVTVFYDVILEFPFVDRVVTAWRLLIVQNSPF